MGDGTGGSRNFGAVQSYTNSDQVLDRRAVNDTITVSIPLVLGMQPLSAPTRIAMIIGAVLLAVLAGVLVSNALGNRFGAGDSTASPFRSDLATPTIPVPPETASPPTGELPEDIRDLPWVASADSHYEVGTLGAGPILALPDEELGLAASGEAVLSVDRSTNTQATVRDIATGDVLGRINANFVIDQGLIRGDSIYIAGREKGAAADAGVWQTSINGKGLTRVMQPIDGEVAEAMRTRSPLAACPSGNTIGSTVCTDSGCLTQVLDVAVGSVTEIADASLAWLSDQVAIMIDGKEIRAYGLGTGRQLWSRTTEGDFYGAYFLTDETTVISSSTEGLGDSYVYEIARVNAQTGHREVLISLADPVERELRLIGSVSSDAHATLLSQYTFEDALATSDGVTIRVVDVATGALWGPAVQFTSTK